MLQFSQPRTHINQPQGIMKVFIFGIGIHLRPIAIHILAQFGAWRAHHEEVWLLGGHITHQGMLDLRLGEVKGVHQIDTAERAPAQTPKDWCYSRGGENLPQVASTGRREMLNLGKRFLDVHKRKVWPERKQSDQHQTTQPPTLQAPVFATFCIQVAVRQSPGQQPDSLGWLQCKPWGGWPWLTLSSASWSQEWL